jgi:hypothetical protein
MRFVNRAVLILRARPPYVDWANGLRDVDPAVTLEAARTGGSAFLVPTFETDAEAVAFVERHASVMFEHELSMWMDDAATWPAVRNAATFHAWFDVEVHDIAVDLGEDGLAAEELG